ncbi:hypothetical protein DV736_g3336, partial [Chaetothyriales sp. CBS 134916]
MSRRTIGGGRVLGSGRNISATVIAPAAAPKTASPLPINVLSPSASTISLNSTEGSSTPPTLESQDIASRVSLDHGPPNLSRPAAGADDRLVCPICSEEMVTLLQLNRHLDDAHKEIEVEEQDEVKDWFKQQMLRAKKFQPLAVLNQKLKGLDVFESNHEATRASTPQLPPQVATGSNRDGVSTSIPPSRPKEVVDPDDVVSKTHWQKRSGYDTCADPTCDKRLGPASAGIVNCRHCGKLFCEEHTMYQMKLSRSAQHEPFRGYWCRVCETCYKSRDGYNDRHGFERERTSEFFKLRQDKHNKMVMEASRLEKRLTRLSQLLTNPPEEVTPIQPQNKRWSLAAWTQNDPRKVLEQTVVAWQEDADVVRCPYCQQDFTQYTFRRHHCRTCGKVVCGDPATKCSIILPLNVETTDSRIHTEKPAPNDIISLDIRLCKECNQTLFSHRDFEASLSNPQVSAFVKSYQNLLQFERGIRLLIPKFQKLLQALQDPDAVLSTQQISNASRTRKRLMDSFAQYDIAARRIRDMSSQSPTQLKLQKAIYDNASQFLHLHMLPLKSLPKVLKHATPNGRPAPNGISQSGKTEVPKSALASIHYSHMHRESSSNISVSTVSSRISELEASEKELRERLIVLEEQKFLVQEMIADANKRRKFDEVSALAGNVEDLSREIDEVSKMVEGVLGEIGDAYTEGAARGLGSGVMSPVPRGSRITDIGNPKGKDTADHG